METQNDRLLEKVTFRFNMTNFLLSILASSGVFNQKLTWKPKDQFFLKINHHSKVSKGHISLFLIGVVFRYFPMDTLPDPKIDGFQVRFISFSRGPSFSGEP